jgi:hypothetical protein
LGGGTGCGSGSNPSSANIVSTSATDTGGDTYEITVEWESSDPDGDLTSGTVPVIDIGPGGNS